MGSSGKTHPDRIENINPKVTKIPCLTHFNTHTHRQFVTSRPPSGISQIVRSGVTPPLDAFCSEPERCGAFVVISFDEEFSLRRQESMRFEDRRNMGGEDAKSRKMFPAKLFEILVRIVPAILCVAAMVMMLNNHQINEDGALQYDNVAGFKYVVYANGICAGYSVFSAVGSALCGSYGLPGAWILFILDQALTYMMVTAGGVATEVLYLGYRGDDEAVWSKGCVSYAKFCNRAAASVVATFVALGCFVMLSLLSAHRLFSNYEPPLQANRELTASQA